MTARNLSTDRPRSPPSLLRKSGRTLLRSLLRSENLAVVVPRAVNIVERDPLVSVGFFSGDLLRGLMEVPGDFWYRQPELYDRYREALRRNAALRRQLPLDERRQFWSALEPEMIG